VPKAKISDGAQLPIAIKEIDFSAIADEFRHSNTCGERNYRPSIKAAFT